MKVKDLIQKLKEFPEEMEVTVWADHGNTISNVKVYLNHLSIKMSGNLI
jgi:hypothetical protein